MTHDPSSRGAAQPLRDAAESTQPRPSEKAGVGGAAFRALLEQLENQARGLHRASEEVDGAADLPDAVDHARASVDEAQSLGDRLLEAYRAARQQDRGGDEPGGDKR